VIWKSIDENDAGIRSEGGRLVANLIKTLHRVNASALAEYLIELGGVTLLIQIITGYVLTSEASQARIHSESAVQFSELSSSRGQVFPIVQNEGIIALILLYSLSPKCLDRILEYTEPLLVAINCLLDTASLEQNSQKTIENITFMNICQLMLILSRNDGKHV
jgi:hypothetical protein